MMANVSTLVNANWWLGIPFFTLNPLNLDIMVAGERILGDHLLGFQVGNEPDLYVGHKHRTSPYGPADYAGEFGVAVACVHLCFWIARRGADVLTQEHYLELEYPHEE
jgi:hypothetical protein